jgi:hypothetical protein
LFTVSDFNQVSLTLGRECKSKTFKSTDMSHTHTQHFSLFTPMSQVSFQPPSDARQRFERNTCRRSCSLLCLGL